MSTSLISRDRLDVLADCVRATVGVPGDMAELGVYRGGSAKVILEAMDAYDPRRVYLIDTFDGLPRDGGDHRKGEFSATIEDVRKTLGPSILGPSTQYPLGISRVVLLTGVFSMPEMTLDKLTTSIFSFVHVDADLYESTRDAIAFFWPRMSSGGIMVFDDVDWPSCPGVNRALEEAGLMGRIERRAKYQGVLVKP